MWHDGTGKVSIHYDDFLSGLLTGLVLSLLLALLAGWTLSLNVYQEGVTDALDTALPCQEAGGKLQNVSEVQYVCTEEGWRKIE
jgi:hypothetical protein